MLGVYISLALKRQVEYKFSFYTFIFNQVVSIVVWLVFWKVLFTKLGNLGIWDFNKMIMLTGFLNINTGLFAIFGYIWRLPQDIINGNLNSTIIRPVHPFAHMMLKQMNLKSMPRLAMGAAVVTYGIVTSPASISPLSITLSITVSLLSFITSLMPFATICLSAFWIGRADFIRDLFVELFLFERYPLSEFPKSIVVFFSLFVPLIFCATVPVLILSEWNELRSLLVLLAMIAIITLQMLVFIFTWRKGLRRYESYGG